MKLAVAGTGYVGLVTAVCLAEKGHDVTCVDVDKQKIELLQSGVSPIFEQDLEGLMARNAERLHYTTDYESAYRDAEIVFIGVGTPEKKDGSANLTYVYSAAKQIAETVRRDCAVVLKSTVPIGTNEKIEKIMHDYKVPEVMIHVVSNPEFLAQGTAVRDTLFPSRIVVGVEDGQAERIMREVYKGFEAPLLVTNRRSAEMIKYASNDFLALKISYINEIANLCELVGANVQDVAKGMGFDPRIGSKFLNAGIGYGGSCFPKDTKALHWLASMNDYELKTVKAAIEVNEQQKLKLIKKARKYYDNLKGLTVAVLGLTFKPGTDDLREAPSLVNIPILLEDGAYVRAFDPIGVPNFKKYIEQTGVEGLDNLSYYESIEETINGADICFIFTEWDVIKQYESKNYKKLMKKAIVLDGRNCLDVVSSDGLIYECIGK
ncbi:UDP-glucose dehydrogenase family protein [Paenibacillus soyae]|uniref:UDP-glucose 6-dehydrogenase n=1 Tax=Paenibacillus soyae TaxID=2969249 RepID=A0A9X2MUS6_9BACL|nr:UDP-glucose/GDP-mannose dehydrogenase family protein [Paenibacillus soyae]MCR2807401.1 UDP-glucose/GDP-mannose dehydrogenase family protein [Paenibacillus soyae]